MTNGRIVIAGTPGEHLVARERARLERLLELRTQRGEDGVGKPLPGLKTNVERLRRLIADLPTVVNDNERV